MTKTFWVSLLILSGVALLGAAPAAPAAAIGSAV